ncbi:tetratricopeptide repeat protein [Thalassotalea montiporae]
MDEKLQQALSLVKEGKLKKALPLAKKLNSKLKSTSFESMELEGVIYFQLVKYQQARLKFIEALKLSITNEQRINSLNNLKACEYKLDEYEKAISCLEQILSVDSSIASINYRHELCQLAWLHSKNEILLTYIDSLINANDFTSVGLVLKIHALCALGRGSEINGSLVQVDNIISKLKTNEAEILCNALALSKQDSLLNESLTKLEARFSHEAWYKALVSPLKDIENKNMVLIKPKQQIVCDNKNIEPLVSDFIKTLLSMGASIHPDVRVYVENGNLSIKAFNDDASQLLSVPLQCMPLSRDYDLTMDGNKLHLQIHSEVANPAAIPIMEQMVALYNACDKINEWSTSFPLLALRHHNRLINFIFEYFLQTPKFQNYKHLWETEDFDELAIRSFFGSREFQYSREALNKAGVSIEGEYELGLLAIIDFLNHKLNSSGYELNQTKGSVDVSGAGDTQTREVFVEYNLLDPAYTYFLYGFVDSVYDFVYSAKQEVSLLNGRRLILQGSSGRADISVIRAYPHLAKFLPAQVSLDKGDVVVNCLPIPNDENHAAFKQVIEYILIQTLGEAEYNDPLTLKKEILNIERQVVFKTLSIWKGVKTEFLSEVDADESLSEFVKQSFTKLIETNITYIESYISREKVSLVG